ncbi:hypothetical protein JessAGP_006c [Caulobacter phage Jess A]|nr:hypothetical protein JessAGP_006c [Caulobacter phage Jess A]QNH91658.1 hypothetical protein SR18_gp007c [Caulobacter phage SR18]WCA46415.1 hypothetical protein [Caulobacter phage RapA]WCD56192.1 hypothetical protein [Caulobacter phage BL94]
MTHTKTGMEEACEKQGGASSLARALDVTPTAVLKWRARGWAPEERIPEISALTGVERLRLARPETIENLGLNQADQ